jgi:hypothetical protein
MCRHIRGPAEIYRFAVQFASSRQSKPRCKFSELEFAWRNEERASRANDRDAIDNLEAKVLVSMGIDQVYRLARFVSVWKSRDPGVIVAFSLPL